MPIQITPNALPPVRPPVAEPASAGNGDFAQLMAQQPVDDAGAAPEAAAPPAHADEARAAKARQGQRHAAARQPQPETRRATNDGARAAGAADDEARVDSPDTADGSTALDPALTHWLAHQQQPPAEATTAEPAASGTAGLPAGPRRAPTQGPAPDDMAKDALAPAQGQPAGRGAAAHAERPGRDAAAKAELAASRTAEDAGKTTTPLARETAAAPATPRFTLPAGFEHASATPGASGSPTPTADAPLSVPLSVPLASPDFAEAFGVQVSVLARDGVQQAELHLNPAEMGPVSVQIALDGERARIDFGAQAAATRAAIEASLPELAAALRDAGLTLAGGGVSQHTPGRGDADRQAASDGRDTSREPAPGLAAAAAPRPAWRGRVSASGVDLYA